MSQELAPVRRRDLKARAHLLKPVVWIGAAGLSENVIQEVDQGLTSHELIKVKISNDERQTRTAWLNEICNRLGAEPVQHIGKILVIYRPQPEKTVSTEPKGVRKERSRSRNSNVKRRMLARSNRS
jgi:putative YhbY family RNA-binding protein